ncbi:transposase domain-containing protein [Rubellimicrobium aerolatum]|uniref:Transposase domain-containing protein n=1 Tax=Rubellimicrobium aerolatum TaxID=490979 RepID=A0ABW0SF21_9RHOB
MFHDRAPFAGWQRRRLNASILCGWLEIDNSPLENQIRKIALLRKNALFAGTEMGAKTWMVFASLVETCELNRADPWAYFRWLFKKSEDRTSLKSHQELMPWKCPVGRR